MVQSSVARGSVVFLGLALAGCRCGPEEEAPPSRPAHYPAWDALVDAAWQGDLDGAGLLADELRGDSRGTPAAREASMGSLGGALGMIRMAEDRQELAEAVAAVGGACGTCHQHDGVEPPARPSWSHRGGDDWVAWGLAWSEASPPPAGGEPPLDALARAWSAPPAPDTGGRDRGHERRAARLLVACAGCHAGGSPTRTPGSP